MALFGVAGAYMVLLLVSQRGDMAEVAFLHALVACLVVMLVSLAARASSGGATVTFAVLATVSVVIWLLMGYVIVWLFSCGAEGCFY